MFLPFFALAARSPGRREAFRNAVIGHLLVLTGALFYAHNRNAPTSLTSLAHILLIAGIVEGAFLIGWRLTQLPKSQALEFLLVSPLRPRYFFLAEAIVGLARLGLVTLSGLPVLLLFALLGRQDETGLKPLPPLITLLDLVPLLVMPFTWGAFTGLTLTTWAYESLRVRRWFERLALAGIVFYLAVGVLAGENLMKWLRVLPDDFVLTGPGAHTWTISLRSLIFDGFRGFHDYNPFGVLKYWFERFGLSAGETESACAQMGWLELGGVIAAGLLLGRASGRLQEHFHERHYSPILDVSRDKRGVPGERPLSWWAVRRVSEFSGRINVWLAAGFGTIYALYTVAESSWPPWLGRGVFLIFESTGGIPALATALVILAAVPAAFQYGLWDSNAQDRCRRLELLLLTELDATDYWHAAASAAWQRGRSYFAVAVILWGAAAVAGKAGVVPLTASLASGVLLWSLYFVLGFRAFTQGMQANFLGVMLTIGLPLLTTACYRGHWLAAAALLPPGSVYGPAAGLPPLYWLPGPILVAGLTLILARRTLAQCEDSLRNWYALHHGRKVMD